MARRRLMAFDWPGNVRQLRNVIESMVVVDCRRRARPRRSANRTSRSARRRPRPARQIWRGLVGKPLTEIERLVIGETLKFTGGNRETRPRCSESANGRYIARSRNMGCERMGAGSELVAIQRRRQRGRKVACPHSFTSSDGSTRRASSTANTHARHLPVNCFGRQQDRRRRSDRASGERRERAAGERGRFRRAAN